MEFTPYRLPDGRTVNVDASAAKQLPVIRYEIEPDARGRRRFVLAERVDSTDDPKGVVGPFIVQLVQRDGQRVLWSGIGGLVDARAFASKYSTRAVARAVAENIRSNQSWFDLDGFDVAVVRASR
jgi:hypothetical protein